MIGSTCKIEEEISQAVRTAYQNAERCEHIAYTQEGQSTLSEQDSWRAFIAFADDRQLLESQAKKSMWGFFVLFCFV